MGDSSTSSTSAWRERLKIVAIVFAVYLVAAEAKQLVDDMLFNRGVRKRRELEQRMHVDQREGWLLEDLKAYDGRDLDSPILLAIDGRVFNVWRSRHLYGAGGSYAELAGRDATRMLAKGSLDESADDGAPLTQSEREAMEGWKAYFEFKYDDCGTLLRRASEGEGVNLA
mmetsp:Transcript_77781/g.217969  ORF Transcript_77781/g.217969 Transcript_77781/m.217969 type:complete len:170 (+) Transcript_77781:99-608(+)